MRSWWWTVFDDGAIARLEKRQLAAVKALTELQAGDPHNCFKGTGSWFQSPRMRGKAKLLVLINELEVYEPPDGWL